MRMRIFVILGLAVCSVATNATAQNAVPCGPKPWAIPDKWIDNHDDPNDGVWTPDDTFETVDRHGIALSDPDVYVPPSWPFDPTTYTGFTVQHDLGRLLTLKLGAPQDGPRSGFFYAIDIGIVGEGGDAYRTAIATCQQETRILFGETLQPLPGNLNGPTVQGVADLINLDPDAVWDPVAREVINSCAPSPSCGSVSPRIVSIAAFDPAVFEASLSNAGQPQLVVTNLIGVFIDGVIGGKVVGYLTALPDVK
jgi:hypothetical protein